MPNKYHAKESTSMSISKYLGRELSRSEIKKMTNTLHVIPINHPQIRQFTQINGSKPIQLILTIVSLPSDSILF